MSKRRLKLLGKILLGFIVLVVAFLLIERWRGQIALAGYKKELRAKGEKLSPQDFMRTFNEEDNGAPAVFAAKERLVSGGVLPDSYPPRMRLLKSGRAIVGFREPQWVEKDPYRDGEWLKGTFTNHWVDLAADLQANAAVLLEIQAALTKPVLNNQLNLAEGSNLKLTSLAPAKSLPNWFGGASQLALHEDRTTDAARYLMSEIAALRLLAEDGVVISELVRIAMGAIAKTDTWEALQADGWADSDLAALQNAWEKQSFMASMATSLEGERVYMEQTVQQLHDSNDEMYEWIFSTGADDMPDPRWMKWLEETPYGEALLKVLRKQIYCRVWRFAWADQERLRTLKNIQALIELARTAAINTSYHTVKSDLEALDKKLDGTNKTFYDRLRFPLPDGVIITIPAIQKPARAEADRAQCITAIALKRYSLRHGKLPDNLNALVPEFFIAVPIDYMDGKPIKYRLNGDGGFTLYSVGENGIDDGGDMTLREGSKSRDLWRRRDYVWPAPATPEEVEDYRRNAGKD